MSKYAIEPVGDRVFVRRGETVSKTQGGLVIPDKSQEASRTGIVVAVGPGALRAIPDNQPPNVDPTYYVRISTDPLRFPMQCQVGDKVLLPHSAEVIRLNPEDEKDELVVCQECQLLAILR